MVLARADPRDGPEMELRAPRCEGRAPRTIAENLSSSALPGSLYPDPPPKPKRPPVPPAPSTKVEQLASSSMTLSKQYEKPKEAAGKATPGNPSSKAAQNSSSVFGTPRQWESPTQTNGNARPQSANPSTKAEQNSSSLFGTPRYSAPPPRRASTPVQMPAQRPLKMRPASLVSPQITFALRIRQGKSNRIPIQRRHRTLRLLLEPRAYHHHRSRNNVQRVSRRALLRKTHRQRSARPRYSSPPPPGPRSGEAIAPGEMALPTPRTTNARSTAEQQRSASLPGTAWEKPPPKPRAAPKEPARSTAEQQRSSVFGSPRYASPPPPPVAAEAAAKRSGGRNASSVFPGQTTHQAPPPQHKKTKAELAAEVATSKAAQGRSTVFGSPRYSSPPPPWRDRLANTLGYAWVSPRVRRAQHPPQRPHNPYQLFDRRGKPRGAETKAEAQVSSVLGGSPQLKHLDGVANAAAQHRARSIMRVEFKDLPPDIDTFRLQQRISQLCGPDIVAHAEYVKRDVLNGRPQGGAMSYFRNVPAGNDDVMNAIRSEQAERIGPLRGSNARVVFDTRNRAWL